jgi:acetyl esterase
MEHAPVLDAQTQKFVDTLSAAGGPPIYTLSPNDAREVLASAQAQPEARQPASIRDTEFPVGPTGRVRMRIVKPQRAQGVLPVVMYVHGGGWILGDKNTHDRLVRELANGTNAAVFFVDYERSPEARYPVWNARQHSPTLHAPVHLGSDADALGCFCLSHARSLACLLQRRAQGGG